MPVVAKVGVEKEEGYLYYVDKNGNIARKKMARGGKKGRKIVRENKLTTHIVRGKVKRVKVKSKTKTTAKKRKKAKK